MPPPAKPRTRGASRPAAGSAGGAASTNWLRSIRFSGFTVLMLVVLVLFVVVVAPGARIFIEQRQQIADLQNSLQSAQAQNATLNSQVARWGDPAYIRAEARERLYFVMPGETAFLVLNDTQAGSAASSAPVSTSIQSTQTNWMAALFASGMTAGLSTETAGQLGATGQLGSGTGAASTDPAATPTPTPTP
ncbi:FtsB family cell division protein [Subtercola endophyticus]|uniref:FtsB family cell division protein n=1 Tax=Subtercola endophyticus TaxID=2895559 RepID=UPI001E4E9888|nr:septum formation initiator family protein [Subtercola endophyticus]UFS59782.1 septum formation initiator family protein [Subtercola endophyticus]